MNDDDKIDFSALDVGRDAKRYERLVARTTARAIATRRPSVSLELSRLSWPLLTGAAAVCVLALLMVGPLSSGTGSNDSLSADSFAEWANQGSIPSGVDISDLAGDNT